MSPRRRRPELLQGPLRRRVGGDVVMEDSPSAQFHDHEYVKGAKSGRNHNEEVTRHDPLGMVMDEGQPTLLWIGRAHRAVAQVLLHGTGRYSNPEFQVQLVGDAFLAPGRILGGHLSDQLSKVLG